MSWSSYLSYLACAGALVLIPGVDFTLVVKNTLSGGAWRGRWSATGVATSNALQGLAAVAGLGAVIAHCQPLFQVIRWAGVGYLAYLAARSLRSAWRGRYERPSGEGEGRPAPARAAGARAGWRQGFLSNVTNPKVLVFYLAVLPQFVDASTPSPALAVFALSHAALSLAYLTLVASALARVRRALARRSVRRVMEAATGVLLLGFCARLATERP